MKPELDTEISEPDLSLLSAEERAEIEREAETEVSLWQDKLESEIKNAPEDAADLKARDAAAAGDAERLAAATLQDLQPLFARVRRILQIEDTALFLEKSRQLLNELPQLLKDMNADPDSARVLEQIMGAAFAKGLVS